MSLKKIKFLYQLKLAEKLLELNTYKINGVQRLQISSSEEFVELKFDILQQRKRFLRNFQFDI